MKRRQKVQKINELKLQHNDKQIKKSTFRRLQRFAYYLKMTSTMHCTIFFLFCLLDLLLFGLLLEITSLPKYL